MIRLNTKKFRENQRIRESAKTSKLLSGKIDNNIFQEKKYYF